MDVATETVFAATEDDGWLRRATSLEQLRLTQSYRLWRAWQKRVFICRLTSSFSATESQAILTALQPFFSCDLAACVAGPLPNFFACVQGPADYADTAERFEAGDVTQSFHSNAVHSVMARARVAGPHVYTGHRHQRDKQTVVDGDGTMTSLRRRRLSCGSDISGTSSVCLAVRLLGRPGGHHMAAFRVCRPPPPDSRLKRFVRSISHPDLTDVGTLSMKHADEIYDGCTPDFLADLDLTTRSTILCDVMPISSPDLLSFVAQCLQERIQSDTNINAWPTVVLTQVFCYLTPHELCTCAAVCRNWQAVANSDVLWREHCKTLRSLFTGDDVELLAQLQKGDENAAVDWRFSYHEMEELYKRRKSLLRSSSPRVQQHRGVRSQRLAEFRLSNEEKIQNRRKAPVVATSISLELPTLEFTSNAAPREDRVKREWVKKSVSPIWMDRALNVTPVTSSRNASSLATSFIDGLSMSRVASRLLKEPSRDTVSRWPAPRKVISLPTVALDKRPIVLEKAQIEAGMDVTSLAFGDIDEDDEEGSGALAFLNAPVMTIRQVLQLQGKRGNAILCAEVDSRRVICGCFDGIVRIWDIRSGRWVGMLASHKGGVRCLQFRDDIIVSGSWDTSCKVWDAIHFEEKLTLNGHSGSVSCLAFIGDHLISGSDDATLCVWSTKTWMTETVLEGHQGAVTSLCILGRRLFSSSADKMVRCWSTETWAALSIFLTEDKPISCLLGHNQLLVTASSEGAVSLYNAETGEKIVQITAHDRAVQSLAFDQHWLFTASRDKTVKQWDLATGQCKRALAGHLGTIMSVRTVNNKIVTCSEDGTTRLWLGRLANKPARSRGQTESCRVIRPVLVQADDL